MLCHVRECFPQNFEEMHHGAPHGISYICCDFFALPGASRALQAATSFHAAHILRLIRSCIKHMWQSYLWSWLSQQWSISKAVGCSHTSRRQPGGLEQRSAFRLRLEGWSFPAVNQAFHTAGFPDLAERKHVSKLSQHASKHAHHRRWVVDKFKVQIPRRSHRQSKACATGGIP